MHFSFAAEILAHLDSATSSTLLQSYFTFHTRSGFINESLLLEHLLSLQPRSSPAGEQQMKFLLQLLFETLKTLNVTIDRAPRLGKQLNQLARWLCSALCVYATDETDNDMLILLSNLFLLLFTNTSFYCLWLMIIKADKQQIQWRQQQEQLAHLAKHLAHGQISTPEVFQQILFK